MDTDCWYLVAIVISRGDRDEAFRNTRLYKRALELATPRYK